MLGGGGLRRREVVGVEDEGKHWSQEYDTL